MWEKKVAPERGQRRMEQGSGIEHAGSRVAAPPHMVTRPFVWSTGALMAKTLPISEVKTHLPELVGGGAEREEEVVVTRKGKPAAVLVNFAEYERLKATLDVSPLSHRFTEAPWRRADPGGGPAADDLRGTRRAPEDAVTSRKQAEGAGSPKPARVVLPVSA
jgi:prevent-host-death family protein